MSEEHRDAARSYTSALEKYLEHGDEVALSAAYELGRRALADGRGLLDIALMHEEALELLLLRAPTGDQQRIAAGAASFFRELVSPFEMTLSGYRAANDELARVNDTLRQQKEALETVNRELETFSYSVSHDLRAPLRTIDGFSVALLEDCADKLDDVGKKYLGHVREAAQHMAQLIDALLSLARVARTELHRTDVDVSALARRAIDRLRAGDPRRDVRVVVQEGVHASGDSRLLAVVLDNLLGNAWKFTSKQEHAEIEFGCSPQGSEVVYFVRDNGAGFDINHAAKLFGAFQRLHTTREFEGTGIGLATVQRIVHRHDGRVWAEGKVNGGATFSFTLEGRRKS
jgi:light-regulated signal transduction histidine kinase (bacteriophytochrome)